ncbi:MAG: alpha-glucosidase [Bacilli bacterium]
MTRDFISKNAIYQIYPISFCDSNDDGKGDIPGIISKLDYLKSIGIKVIWLSPIYKSPMADMGYDIEDYYDINPIFGTMDDFRNLLSQAKERDIRIIMDLVVNHTSDQCQWFKEAIKNPESPYRDYYIFKKGKKGKEPNNWESSFLGSAWEPVKNEKDTYYLHLFSKAQPDLNFHNEKVIQEVEKIMNFWMDMGVYGFRCDVISAIYKDSFEDGKKTVLGVPRGQEHYIATKGCHQILKRLRKNVVDPHQGVLIGECLGADLDNGPAFLEDELDTFFTFAHVGINQGKWSKEYVDPKVFGKVISDWQKTIDFNGNYLENHDQHRSIGKYIKKGFEIPGSKMLLTLIYTLRGVPFIYMGEELGARDYEKLEYSQCHDCVTSFIYQLATGYGLPKKIAFAKARHNGRDDCRAPMAFNSQAGYGFSSEGIIPWQKYNEYSKFLNVEYETSDTDSTLNYFKKINSFRSESDVLSFGTIEFIKEKDPELLSFIREYQGKRLKVILNFSYKPKKNIIVPEKIILSNYETHIPNQLQPYEAIISE